LLFWGKKKTLEAQDSRQVTMIIPVKRTKQEVPRWVRDVDRDSFYKCICELFEMGAKFTRTASGFDVVFPAGRETDGKRYESVLLSDIRRSLQWLIRFGLVPRSYKTEKKQ
jgi:hypothetical protein